MWLSTSTDPSAPDKVSLLQRASSKHSFEQSKLVVPKLWVQHRQEDVLNLFQAQITSSKQTQAK